MTAPSFLALRQALYDHLSATAGVPVWSPRAPQADDGESAGPFPYLVIVQATITPWNTKTSLGTSALVQIDGYARATATQSAEGALLALEATLRNSLERVELPIAGANLVTVELENTIYGWEADGKTRRFVSQYRVIVEHG